ncbi:hypothetical protein VNO77_46249 [Canavalia gladiata]|uniref:Uncharacterized protein n=1 Tax=Canavalia gladiata TaxID=3824 RepID=A0AAN9JD95_CANGL
MEQDEIPLHAPQVLKSRENCEGQKEGHFQKWNSNFGRSILHTSLLRRLSHSKEKGSRLRGRWVMGTKGNPATVNQLNAPELMESLKPPLDEIKRGKTPDAISEPVPKALKEHEEWPDNPF